MMYTNDESTIIHSDGASPSHAYRIRSHSNTSNGHHHDRTTDSRQGGRIFSSKLIHRRSNPVHLLIGRGKTRYFVYFMTFTVGFLSLMAIILPEFIFLKEFHDSLWWPNRGMNPNRGINAPPFSTRLDKWALIAAQKKSERSVQRRKRTAPPRKSWDDPPMNKFHPHQASLPASLGGLPKCTPSNIQRVLITGILSSPLAMELALSLSSSPCIKIYGIDSCTPNTVPDRWEFIDRLKLLKRDPILQKLVVPFTGIYPHEGTDDANANFVEELEGLVGGVTHIIHVLREDVDVSYYRFARQSMVSMEQILKILKKKSQKKMKKAKFIYISSSSSASLADARYASLKKIDEVLASTYYSLHKVSSIGLRLPHNVYGPWGRRSGDIMYRLAEELVQNSTLSDSHDDDQKVQLISVRDAVQAVYSAMQHTSEGAVVFNVQNGVEEYTVSSVKQHMLNVWDMAEQNEESQKTTALSPLHKGIAELLAWHFYRAYPHGPLPYNKHFRKYTEEHQKPVVYPCASECSYEGYCNPSPFDDGAKLSEKATLGCDIVLYTFNFNTDFDTLPEINIDDSDPRIEEKVCYVIFLSHNSPLLPPSKLPKKAITKNGWILVPIKTSSTYPAASDFLIPKMSPSKLFAPSVRIAMIYRSRTPPPHYVLLQVAGQMSQRAVPAARKWRRRPGTGERFRKYYPPQPPRHIIFMSSQYTTPNLENMNMRDMLEIIASTKLQDTEEEPEIPARPQRLFYEMANGFVRNQLLREPPSVEQMKILRARGLNQPEVFPVEWMRTNWIVHDLSYGKEFRCSWYREQLFWGYDNLEDLSLMYTIARWFGAGKIGSTEMKEYMPIMKGEEEKLVDDKDYGFYVRVLKSPIKIQVPQTQNRDQGENQNPEEQNGQNEEVQQQTEEQNNEKNVGEK